MHFFRRGDRPHLSPPLHFGGAERGSHVCGAAAGPAATAACALSTSAGQSGAPAVPRRSSGPCGGRAVDLGGAALRAGVRPGPVHCGGRAVDLGRPERGASSCWGAAVPRPLRRARHPVCALLLAELFHFLTDKSV